MQEVAQSAQNNIASSVSKTVGNLGLGTTQIAITVASGVTALITHNPRWQKATILLIGGHIINDFATQQIKVSFKDIAQTPAILIINSTGGKGINPTFHLYRFIHPMLLLPLLLFPFVSQIKNGYQFLLIQPLC